MTDWSVELEVRGVAAVDDDVVDVLVDNLAEHAGVVAVFPDGYGARVSVRAASATDAVLAATTVLRDAAAAAGAPSDAVVRCEAMTHRRLDRELDAPTVPEL